MSSWQKVDQFDRDLALAVHLTDGVGGGQPVGEQQVLVVGSEERPVRNQSGYYLFFDLPAEEVTVKIDGGDNYRDATKTVNLNPNADDTHDTGEAVEFSLDPTTAYPFPSGLTRVRGTVWHNDTPESGVNVSVSDHPRIVETTESGEFVYYFDNIDPDDIEKKDPQPEDHSNIVKRLYKPDGSHPQFVVDGSPGQIQRSFPVEVGTLTTKDIKY